VSGKWRDYYSILGVRHDATPSEIKEAWIFGVKAFHPDKFAGSSQRQQAVAQERTKAVNEAYYVLSDASRRANYDWEYARRTSSQRPPPPPHSSPPPEPSKPAASAAAPPNEKNTQRTETRKTDVAPDQKGNQFFRAIVYGAALYIPWLIAAAMLVSAAVEKHPYNFYTLLRWVCCTIFVWSAFVAHEKDRRFWAWLFGALAALYNPIIVVHLNRSTWINVNWFTCVVIIVAAIAFLPRCAQIWMGAMAALIVAAVGLWQLHTIRPQASVSKPTSPTSASPPAISGTSPNAASYRVAIRDGLVTVVELTSNRIVGSTTLERWGVTALTDDKLRHVALDLTAALVAGGGGREHTVAPELPVYTLEDVNKGKSPTVTATAEHGSAFYLLSDTKTNDGYDALIGMGKFQPASSSPNETSTPDIFGWISADTPIPRAIPRAVPVTSPTDSLATEEDRQQSRSPFDLFDTARTAPTADPGSIATEPPASDSTQQQTARRPKIVYAPHPSYPAKADKMHITGSGRFKITFDERGNTKSVEVVQSTGNTILDSNTVKTLKQWRSAPNNGSSSVVVPIDYQQRRVSRRRPQPNTVQQHQSVPAPQSATAPIIDPNISR